MRLRTFHVNGNQALRLSNRCYLSSPSQTDEINEYIEKFLDNPEIIPSTEPTALRSYYLSDENDIKLGELSKKLGVSKGTLFRIALDKGLGTPPIG